MNQKEMFKIVSILKKEYPQAKIALKFNTIFELLVATILSAQCTDKRVNIVTEELFKKYKTIQNYAEAGLNEFENNIRSAGFYKNKAKNIVATARKIKKEFGGKVPDTMEELLTLPGVARKTANIVLFNAFGKKEGIAVDTHVSRLSQRIGMTNKTQPEKIEKDLIVLLPKKEWGKFSCFLIEHGRKICQARKPKCLECVLKKICPSKVKFYS